MLVVWTELETSQDCRRQKILKLNKFSFCSFVLSRNAGLNKTVQSQIYRGLLKTVLTCHQFNSHHAHRQDKPVLSVSAVWTRHYIFLTETDITWTTVYLYGMTCVCKQPTCSFLTYTVFTFIDWSISTGDICYHFCSLFWPWCFVIMLLHCWQKVELKECKTLWKNYSQIYVLQPVWNCIHIHLFAVGSFTVVSNVCWLCRYDHLRKEASDPKPAQVDKIAEPWRAALESSFTDYVHNHYNNLGSVTVYGSSTAEGNITLTACIESHQFSPRNFW